jgi:DNA-binding MarR family transcriptional regulator
MDRIRNLGFLMKDVSRLWVRYFESHADQLGMTLTQAKVLVYLSRNEGCTQARLAELCDTDPMTLVRVLDRMEKDGFIERRPDPSDRRAYRLFLKPASDPVIAEIGRIGDRARSESLAGLSNEDRTKLIDLLEHVHANLLALIPTAASEPARTSAPTHTSAPRGRRTSDASSLRRRRKATP